MSIHYLNGPRLSRALLAGAGWVVSRAEFLNKINVFPVADNDTGTNMALTMRSIQSGLLSSDRYSIQAVGEVLSDAALMGAQGNSGAILAQFFHGFSANLDGRRQIRAKHFTKAVINAVEEAYEALAEPVEGTILTVMKAWSEALQKASAKSHDFVYILSGSLEEAKECLARTPKMMKMLAKAGVVDAGAQGFVYMLEGINRYIQSGSLLESAAGADDIPDAAPNIENAPEDIKYQYCTECLLTSADIVNRELSAQLAPFGDSIIVAGSSIKARIHIHTDTPQDVFGFLEKHGDVTHQKYDDMKEQHAARFKEMDTERIALVADSSCDLPEELYREYDIKIVPIRVNFGSESFLDKVSMSTQEFYDYFLQSPEYPNTSQPSPADFKQAYSEVARKYTHAVSIHITGAASGTLQSAQTVSRSIPDLAITTIDSKTVTVAHGLLVKYAGKLIAEGKSYDEVVSLTRAMVDHVHILISIAEVDYLIKGGRVPALKGRIAKLFNIKPILTFNETGAAEPVGKTIGSRATPKKVMEMIQSKAENYTNHQFAIAHAHAPEIAQYYMDRVLELYPDSEPYIVEASPALGAHAGIGAGAVAFLGEPK